MRSALLPPFLCLLLTIAACSRSGTPALPELAASAVGPALAPLALLDVRLDPAGATIEVLAEHHSAALGDSYTLDALPHFRSALRVAGIRRIASDTLGLTLAVRHPLPLPSEGEPGGRLDLHCTDVAAVFLFDGSGGVTLAGERLAPGWMPTALGYTGLLHPSFAQGFATTATVHPYVILSADTRLANFDPASPAGWTDVRAPQGFNVLPMGADWRETEVVLRLPPGSHAVRIALQASLQQAATAATRLTPAYAHPEGNQKAAWYVGAEIWNNRLTAGETDSTAELDVVILDWQQGVAAVSGWIPQEHKGLVRERSEIERVRAWAPGLGWEAEADLLSARGTGQLPDPYVVTLLVRNQAGAAAGGYWGLIEVTDSRSPAGLLDAGGNPVIAAAYKTYQTVALEVHPANGPARLVGLRIAPEDREFLGVEAPFSPLPMGLWSDGSTQPLTGVQHTLQEGTGVALSGGVWTRTLARDASGSAVVRSFSNAHKVRTSTTLVLGDPYADAVISYEPACGASGQNPLLALGGPRGAGTAAGNTSHVVSLGYGGRLTLALTDGGIVDGPGPDFIVFENAFEIGQNPDTIFTETCLVEVSANGIEWFAFPMEYLPLGETPWRTPANFSGMAGIGPVLANVDSNSIDPTDPAIAGGDAFDLADLALPYAQFIRLTSTGIDSTSPCYNAFCPVSNRMVDQHGTPIDDEGKRVTCSGMIGGPDIDAVAIVRGHQGLRP